MAVHRGRIDLLEEHRRRDARVLSRTFSHAAIYPPALGCHADHSLAPHGTPLAGTTLLHLCVDNDEIEMAGWMIERGADVNANAAVAGDGFGGGSARSRSRKSWRRRRIDSRGAPRHAINS